VWNIIDGDTFDAFPVGRIRLADIDAPNEGESGYDASRNYLESLIDHRQVYLDVDDNSMDDSHRRLICVVYVRKDDTHLWNVNKKMVVENHAVINDYTNNEFDPNTWTETVYYPTTDLPEASYPQLLSDYQQLKNEYKSLQNQYSDLQALYNQKVAEYNGLLTQYNELNNTVYTLLITHDLNMSYVDLLTEYNTLNAIYVEFFNEYGELNTSYRALNDEYDNLNTTYTKLQGDYRELQTDFLTLEDEHDTLNDTYLQLQTDYTNLQTLYEQSSSALGLYQPLSYVLIAISMILGVIIILARKNFSQTNR
jgi:hypothetical protein